MALACVDEALRNLTCVGADAPRAALLDNFCWGSPEDPASSARWCAPPKAAATRPRASARPSSPARTAFYNQSKDDNGQGPGHPRHAADLRGGARSPDVRKAVTMDFKGPGNALYLVGWTNDELGGSLFNRSSGGTGGGVP